MMMMLNCKSSTFAISMAMVCLVELIATVAGAQIGALYQISNSNLNTVLVWSVQRDGSLVYRKEVPTGGLGTAGGADSLHSQGAVAVVRNNLFAVNAASNQLSYFTIGREDATALNFIANADTHGDYPVSVTAYGQTVCVLNGGVNNGFRCFHFDALTGLTPNPAWDRSTGLTLTAPGPLSEISFTPDGRALVITLKTPAVLVYPISGGNLADTPVTVVPTGSSAPFGFRFGGVDSNGDVIMFITDPKPGGGGVDVLALNTATGQARGAAFHAIPQAAAVCWAAYSPVTGAFFTIDAGLGVITQVGVDTRDLSISVERSVATGAGGLFDTNTLTASRSLDYLYSLNPRSRVVFFFKVSEDQFQLVGNFTLPADVGLAAQGMASYAQAREFEPRLDE